MYQLVIDSNLIRLTSNDSYFGPGTREYEKYLVWLSLGNQPIPPDALPEIPGYQKFWDLLLVSNIYKKLLQQSFTSLQVNTCCTIFIAAFVDAKTGNPNIPAIQNCIDLILQYCVLEQLDIVELRGLLNISKLDKIFTLNMPVQNNP